MKTKLILAGLLAVTFSTVSYAQQWLGSGTSSGNIYRNGKVGIGGAPATRQFEVITNTYDAGIEVRTDGTANADAMLMLNANPSGGHQYFISSLGQGHTPNITGALNIWDGTAGASRFCIGANGNVGIGNMQPNARLEVLEQGASGIAGIFNAAINITGAVNEGVRGFASNGDMSNIGGNFKATGTTNGSNLGGGFEATGSLSNYGINASATGGSGSANVGGVFASSGTSASQNIGILISCNTSGTPANDWGIYDYGKVMFNGLAYCTGNVWSSDRKLKKDILPLNNGLEKIKLLKPSTYNFRADEFKKMGLPEGPQIGLIAQELEEVFPELVTEIAEHMVKDKNGKVTDIIPQYKGVSYIGLIPVLISGMQEQQKMIEDQAKEIADLKSQVNSQTQSAKAAGINQQNAIDGFSLDQNIPNPFSGEAVIKYNLPQQIKSASLVVYDLTGKKLTTFPLETANSSITISSEKLAAGIYIYSVIADGKIMDSKRMVVTEK